MVRLRHPLLNGFDANAATLCRAGLALRWRLNLRAVASFTVGEIPMSMSYRFEDAAGNVLAFDEVIDQKGKPAMAPAST